MASAITVGRNFVTGVTIALLFKNCCCFFFWPKESTTRSLYPHETKPDCHHKTKFAVVMRTDLRINRPHGLYLVDHLNIEEACFNKTLKEKPKIAEIWEDDGRPSILLEDYVGFEYSLIDLLKEAKENNIVTCEGRDPGYLHFDPGHLLFIGIGPDYNEAIDKLVGKFDKFQDVAIEKEMVPM